MKSLREHLSEALADLGDIRPEHNKNVYAKVLHYVKNDPEFHSALHGASDDIESSISSMRKNDERRNIVHHGMSPSAARTAAVASNGSIEDGISDFMKDHLTWKFGNHPGYYSGPNVPSIASDIVDKHVEIPHQDREQVADAERDHKRNESRASVRAAKQKNDNEIKDTVSRIHPSQLQHSLEFHRSLRDSAAVRNDPEDVRHHARTMFHIKKALVANGFTPSSRPKAPLRTVNVYTKSGTVQRTMKLPPFRKA